MVYYYCEFCNKNINIKTGMPHNCKICGNYLSNYTLTSEEIKRRQKERKGNCNYCNEIVYGVPIDIVLNNALQKKEWELKAYQKSLVSRFPLYLCCIWFICLIPIGLFAPFTYDIEGNLNFYNPLTWILFIYTWIWLIGGSYLIYRQYNKIKLKTKEEKKETIQKLNEKYEKILNPLFNTKNSFQYICPKCYRGVKSKQEIITKKPSTKVICEKCGSENKMVSSFCIECGNSLESVKIKIKGRSRHIPRDVMTAVWVHDDGKCVECGSREDLEFDHIIPFSKGGANTVDNIQILCKKCNLKKSDKI